jgi:RNA polymerase sigma-70 factor (ECF subfamily)
MAGLCGAGRLPTVANDGRTVRFAAGLGTEDRWMRTFEQLEATLAGGAMTMVPRAGELSRYAEDMRRFARRRVRDGALAEDVVQDALLAALDALPTFQGNSSLKTWLLGILSHKIKDAFRTEARYVPYAEDCGRGLPDPDAAWPSAAPGADETLREVSRRRFGAALGEAVARLPRSLREVFQLQAIDGLDTRDVCSRLGISEGNCWVRLHRARKILSVELAGHY